MNHYPINSSAFLGRVSDKATLDPGSLRWHLLLFMTLHWLKDESMNQKTNRLSNQLWKWWWAAALIPKLFPEERVLIRSVLCSRSTSSRWRTSRRKRWTSSCRWRAWRWTWGKRKKWVPLYVSFHYNITFFSAIFHKYQMEHFLSFSLSRTRTHARTLAHTHTHARTHTRTHTHSGFGISIDTLLTFDFSEQGKFKTISCFPVCNSCCSAL